MGGFTDPTSQVSLRASLPPAPEGVPLLFLLSSLLLPGVWVTPLRTPFPSSHTPPPSLSKCIGPLNNVGVGVPNPTQLKIRV